jgi:hypothetical protein
MADNPTTIISARYRQLHPAAGDIATWLKRFDSDLKEQDLSPRDVCALVADVVKGEIERRWVGEAKFADMLLWLACRGNAGVINRISSGAPSWDFHVDVYPWSEVDVWISGGPARVE